LAEPDAAKSESNRFGKLDQRHWKSRLLIRRYVRDGEVIQDTNFYVRVQYQGHRHLFDTGEADKASACRAAAIIYKSILANGWDQAISDNAEILGKARKIPKVESSGTVGALIRTYEGISTTQESSRLSYSRAIRKIYADINNVPKGRKHDSRRGGHKTWIELVDSLALSSVTPDKAIDWKQAMLRAAGNDAQRRRVIVTVNSLIRNAKSLFSRRLLPHIKERMPLPEILPFEGVPLDTAPSTRYRSRINAQDVLKAAREELLEDHPECYLIVCLALQCGLRRAEIDNLLWRSVDLIRRVVHVESNEYYRLKSEDSQGEVDIGKSFYGELKEFKKRATGEFVIESDTPASVHRSSGAYRCQEHLEFVTGWLRGVGVNVDRPLHELRKEVGSVIAQEHGIFAASRFLRHSDIRITSNYYVDKKQTIVPSFG